MKKILAFCLSVAVLTFCNSANKTESIRVASAANLRFAMEEVNQSFEQKTGIKVEMVTASSGKLTAQIKNGAPYHVFLSANLKYPNTLYKEGFTIGKPILFCRGQLVVWTNKEVNLDETLVNLMIPQIKKIGIANPQNAPYGIAAEGLLKKLKLYDSIKPKLVYAENVSQLNQYVINKAVDIGITAKSAVLAPKLKDIGKWKELPLELYAPVEQYVVAIKTEDSLQSKVQKYLKFISNSEAKKILAKYGYSTD